VSKVSDLRTDNLQSLRGRKAAGLWYPSLHHKQPLRDGLSEGSSHRISGLQSLVNQTQQERNAALAALWQMTGYKPARDKLVTSNMGLVHLVARRYVRPGGLELEDIVQHGVIGLMRACDLYDPERSAFSSYAVMWIRQAIGRPAKASSFDGIRRPERITAKFYELRKYTRAARELLSVILCTPVILRFYPERATGIGPA
jgi:DNA-directed RNA polymerase sigma subunit (sigma70/sigma32)